jgi:hypothetical protein
VIFVLTVAGARKEAAVKQREEKVKGGRGGGMGWGNKKIELRQARVELRKEGLGERPADK